VISVVYAEIATLRRMMKTQSLKCRTQFASKAPQALRKIRQSPRSARRRTGIDRLQAGMRLDSQRFQYSSKVLTNG
jgi:hypothetical protein